MATTSLRNAGDVVNAALIWIGWKNQIGNLYDGSAAAVAALAVYGQTRDNLMRDGNYGFAMRTAALTLLKTAPANYTPPVNWHPAANPAPPWMYEYAYADDMLKLRSVRPITPLIPNFDPSPYPFSIADDNYYTPARKVILCNVQSAAAVYTGRVTDPTVWDANFAQALVKQLGEALALVLTGVEAAQMSAVEGREAKATANMEQG